MKTISILQPNHASPVTIGFMPQYIEYVAKQGLADTYIVATEDGFSPLGGNRSFLQHDLGIPYEEIKDLADWNRFENDQVSIIAIPSRRDNSLLKGLILAPCENSKCYRRFAQPIYGKPFRDFYYNVTYESIVVASQEWQAKRIAISHLSACNKFHADIVTSNAEALAHYCDEYSNAAINTLIFMGCCIDQSHLEGIQRLKVEAETSEHRHIKLVKEIREENMMIHIDWD